MRIACVGYRDWALRIYDRLASDSDHTFLIFRSKKQYNVEVLRDFKPDLVLYYGWSWTVSSDILERFTCLMLHPSPLPRYRGGSPIQNQIISGETSSKVTIFVMTDKLDAGDIAGQKDLSLEGTITDIFFRIEDAGVDLSRTIIDNGLQLAAQEDTLATYYRRRSPSESEITIEEIKNKPSIYLYNKIRMLGDPYPNAYITCADGKKLIIKSAQIEEED
jgi:methionyl-tRNA formyltransferase